MGYSALLTLHICGAIIGLLSGTGDPESVRSERLASLNQRL
jgi:hypothetical protein